MILPTVSQSSRISWLQAFCEHCGTPIYAVSPGPEPRIYSLRGGTIHQRDQLRPALQIWARSQLPWLGELGALPKVDKQPA